MADFTTRQSAHRILVSNLPLPTSLAKTADAEPPVEVVSDDIDGIPLLDGNCFRMGILNHKSVPASTTGHGKLEPEDVPGMGIVLPSGVNVYYLDIAPGYTVPIHRTTSVDYMIFQIGELILLTPQEGFDPATGKGKIEETLCRPGDVLVQRSTLHGWANQTTTWARIVCVVLDAETTSTTVADSADRHQLSDVWDV
ncbi:hypothetical protein F5884DRAFT_834323 [Xylogone sp. PMI_703]|nr:hypothetical protein F5884DRAFT_834323 [Xylogone sp. PMI_703]